MVEQKGSAWLTGGDYGPEAKIPALILLIAACFMVYGKKRISPAPEIARLWEDYSQRLN